MTTPRARKQAFTLMELLIVMSAASTLMLLAIGMIHRAMQLESQGRRRAELGRTAIRLSTEFRRDIHAGRSVSIESGSNGATSAGAIPGIRAADAERTTLQVDLPGLGGITYVADGPLVTRVRGCADGRVHREEYRFAPGHRASIEWVEQAVPKRVRLTVVRAAGPGQSRQRVELHLEAVVGRLGQLRVEPSGVEPPVHEPTGDESGGQDA